MRCQIATPISRSTDYPGSGDRVGRLIELCVAVGADVYLTGPRARGYLDEHRFAAAGIAIEYMSYTGYREYGQRHPPFEHEVSVLDLLFEAGGNSPAFLKSGALRSWLQLGDVVVFGSGELARLVHFHLEADSRHDVVAFTVDRIEPGERTMAGLPLVELVELVDLFPPARTDVFVAVGYRRVNRARADVYDRVKALGYRLLTYISPNAIVADGVQLGDNCFVFEGVIVQPAARVGCDTILRSGAVIGHDFVIGDHCFIAPSASISGNAVVGDFSFVGNNATIRDGVMVGPRTVIGAGALIKSNTRAGEIYSPERTRAAEGRDSSELDDL